LLNSLELPGMSEPTDLLGKPRTLSGVGLTNTQVMLAHEGHEPNAQFLQRRPARGPPRAPPSSRTASSSSAGSPPASRLAREELEGYLEHRLRGAGCELPLFEPAAIEAIFQATRALPRKINRLAHYALAAAAAARAKSVTIKHVEAAASEVGS